MCTVASTMSTATTTARSSPRPSTSARRGSCRSSRSARYCIHLRALSLQARGPVPPGAKRVRVVGARLSGVEARDVVPLLVLGARPGPRSGCCGCTSNTGGPRERRRKRQSPCHSPWSFFPPLPARESGLASSAGVFLPWAVGSGRMAEPLSRAAALQAPLGTLAGYWLQIRCSGCHSAVYYPCKLMTHGHGAAGPARQRDSSAPAVPDLSPRTGAGAADRTIRAGSAPGGKGTWSVELLS